MPRRSLTAGFLLMALASACKPGTAESPSSPASGFTLKGTVTGSSGNALQVRAVAGSVVRLTTTDYAGRFEFTDLPRGEYAITPLPGDTFAFTPASRYVTLFDRSIAGQDFAIGAVAAIEGRVYDVGGLGGIGALAVTLTGPVTVVTSTDASGFFRATGLPGGTYAVVPASIPGKLLQPLSVLVQATAGSIVGQNFATVAAYGPQFAISGTVTGPVVEGIVLTLGNSLQSWLGSTVTDAGGHYSFAGIPDATDYVVSATPAPGLLLRSRGRDVTLAGADVSGVDFEQYLPATPRWAYVTARPLAGGSAIYQYAIGAGGSLSPLSPASVAFDSYDSAVAADPTGHFLYAASADTSTVRQFTIGDDGQLTPMATPSVACTSQPQRLAVDPGGDFVWVHNAGSGDLWTFPVGAGGALATTPSSTLAVGGAVDLVVHPAGKALYLVSSGAILQYAIGADGSLSALSPSTVSLSGAPGTFLTALALDPSGRFAYATAVHSSPTYSAWVARFDVDGSGRLTQVGTGGPYSAYSGLWDAGPAEIVADPSGRFVYVGSGVGSYGYGEQVQMYAYDATGAIGMMDPLLANPLGSTSVLAVDPAGNALYIVNTKQGTVGWLPIGANGILTTGGTVATGNGPSSIAVVGR